MTSSLLTPHSSQHLSIEFFPPQAADIGVPKQGPCKAEHYRY